MLYRELNPSRANNQDLLPQPIRPMQASVPANLRRLFPDIEPATLRQQLTESCYDFSHADYIKISDYTDTENTPASTTKDISTGRRWTRSLRTHLVYESFT